MGAIVPSEGQATIFISGGIYSFRIQSLYQSMWRTAPILVPALSIIRISHLCNMADRRPSGTSSTSAHDRSLSEASVKDMTYTASKNQHHPTEHRSKIMLYAAKRCGPCGSISLRVTYVARPRVVVIFVVRMSLVNARPEDPYFEQSVNWLHGGGDNQNLTNRPRRRKAKNDPANSNIRVHPRMGNASTNMYTQLCDVNVLNTASTV
ncbi:uncharacterized protein F5147DRAFT_655910 [Suillus discolor]|uniref:Uncharacterized protein n=1 Tax=Suillus discolor TaxID=1912936 RepID=A0A9P7F0X7_9AGAM|nr:uncharacterized protein F5147DRAFT_655910 [Suillus discolor]KAG2098921.1 hypothetical protein F5147DRAFT_655910 [Suillus discolor]